MSECVCMRLEDMEMLCTTCLIRTVRCVNVFTCCRECVCTSACPCVYVCEILMFAGSEAHMSV